jgi:L-alanine-DL-glutamate epimerase-like enolase superfamily enzyme
VITRVHTDQGIVGEAYAGDEDAALGEIVRIVHEEIEPALTGADAFAVERCWELARPATFDILRDRRLGLVACAGVDAAIWDAVGKHLRQPLWRLWGGYRERLRMIAIAGYYGGGDAGIRDEVEELRQLGLAGMKFKVGGRSPDEDAARFRVAREAAGADFVLAADANQGWTPAEAIRFARLVEDCDLAWLEEPCRWANDRHAMRDVRYAAGVSVCAGQSEYSAAGCRDLMAAGAIDICNFDASWSGGPTEWRRAAAIALAYDVRMGHHEEPQVAAHLLASIPHGLFVECFHPDRDPIWWNLVANRPALHDGWLELPTRPGLGWELDLDYVDRHRVGL